MAVLRAIDAVTVPVPTLDEGIAFYAGRLRHRLLWRNDTLGQAGLALPDSAAEIVLATGLRHEPNWLVADVDAAVADFRASGGVVLATARDTAVGRLAVVQDPFGNPLVLLDLSKGRYVVGPDGDVTGVG